MSSFIYLLTYICQYLCIVYYVLITTFIDERNLPGCSRWRSSSVFAKTIFQGVRAGSKEPRCFFAKSFFVEHCGRSCLRLPLNFLCEHPRRTSLSINVMNKYTSKQHTNIHIYVFIYLFAYLYMSIFVYCLLCIDHHFH